MPPAATKLKTRTVERTYDPETHISVRLASISHGGVHVGYTRTTVSWFVRPGLYRIEVLRPDKSLVEAFEGSEDVRPVLRAADACLMRLAFPED